MERITYRITLDTHKNGIQRTLQGFETADKMARRIVVNLMSSGDTYEIPSDHVVAMVYVTTPNAKEPSINECAVEGNTIVYDALPIVEEGITEMQIKLIQTSATGAKKVLASPRFTVEVAQSGADDEDAEQSVTFTALENAIAQANAVYNTRIIRVWIEPDCNFYVEYADGTIYENSYFRDVLYNGNAVLSESWARGGTGTREGEDTDNSKYYSNISKSSAKNARQSAEEIRELVDEAQMYSAYTIFEMNFETGELTYLSRNYKFDVDENSGELIVDGGEDYTPEKLIGSEVDKHASEFNQALAAERARIDSFTRLAEGSTTGDAELIDGRIDYAGKTWGNIGSHVRGMTKRLLDIIGTIGVANNSADYFDKGSMFDGFYNNGTLTTGNDWKHSDYIPVEQNDDVFLACTNGENLPCVMLYDSDKNYIGQVVSNMGEKKPYNFTIVSSDIKYIVYNVIPENFLSYDDQYLIIKRNDAVKKVFYVGSTRTGRNNFKTLRGCTEYIRDNGIFDSVVYVDAETFDLTKEFESELLTYDNDANTYFGLLVGNNTHFVFHEGSEVKFLYDGNNEFVAEHFSAFNICGSVILENAKVTVKNARYCVHEDMGCISLIAEPYTVEYRNCDMEHLGNTIGDYTGTLAIGAGTWENSLSIIDGGKYKCGTQFPRAISYHNTNTSKPSKIILKNVMVNNGMRFADHGVGNYVDVTISGCYIPNGYISGKYFRVTAWGNEMNV